MPGKTVTALDEPRVRVMTRPAWASRGAGSAGLGPASLVVCDWWARLLVLLLASTVWWVLVPVSTAVAREAVVVGGPLAPGPVAGPGVGPLLRRGGGAPWSLPW